MAKYFQYLIGEKQGEIVTLKDIEEDDDMSFFVFSDGSKCNIELCSPLNDFNAFNNRQIMAEISSPENCWTFKEKVIVPKTKTAVDKEGVTWEIPDPYYDPKGEKGPSQEVKKIEAIPPKFSARENKKANLERFGILEEASMPKAEVKAEKPTIDESSKKAEPLVIDLLEQEHLGMPLFSNAEPAVVNSIGSLKINPLINGMWQIDVNEISQIKLSDSRKEVVIDTKKVLKTYSETITASKSKEDNSPIGILVSKCKKKPVNFNISIEAALPGKSIYNLIKDEYDESDLDHFFDIIIANLSEDEIRKSMKDALKLAYTE